MRGFRSGTSGVVGGIALATCVVATLAADGSSQSSAETRSSGVAVRQMIEKGAYADAEKEATAFVVATEAQFGPQSIEAARALDSLVESLVYNGKGGAASTLPMAERALRIKEQHLGLSDPESAASLQRLGSVHARRGEFATALTFQERALNVRARALGRDSPRTADSLDDVASVLIELQRFQDARQRLDESLRIRERAAAESPADLAKTLGLLGQLHRYAGQYREAIAPLERALALRRNIATAHPDTAALLQVRGDVQFLLGEIRSAQETWANGLAIEEQTLRADHPARAEILRRLGFAAFARGNLAEARQFRERALRIGEQSLAPCDPEQTALLQAMALSLSSEGRYSDARQLYRRALSTVERCAGKNAAVTAADSYATAIYNEATIAHLTGDYAEAERLYARAVQVWSKGLGADHPFVARALDAMAEMAASRGQLTRARATYERVLAARQRTLGESHPQVAWTLTNLAKTVAQSGDVPLALRYVDRAIAIYQKAEGADEADHFARVLELRGTLQARQRNYSDARGSLAEGLAERERIFGRTHPLAAETRAALADVDLALGQPDTALSEALEAEQAGRDHLQFTIRYLPERQALTYAAERPRALDLALSIASDNAAHSASVFDALIRSRGVVLDEFAARTRSVNVADPQVASMSAALATARQRYANLVVRSLEETVNRSLLDEARREKEEAERALAEQSGAFKQELARRDVGLEELHRALPPHFALVSFVRYEKTVATQTKTIAHYAAFVLSTNQPAPTMVSLGAASAIDGEIAKWRREASIGLLSGATASAADTAYRTAGARLRRLVWDPLIPHLTDARRVLLVPDGALNLVNFAALPVGRSEFLVERGPIVHYVSAERDLVVHADAASNATGVLVLGGPAFDDGSAFKRATKTTSPLRGAPVPCGTLQTVTFSDLPATLREANDVAALWKSAGGLANADIRLSVAAQATERAFKRQAPGRRVLHLATHGFFLGSDCGPAAPGTRAVGGLTTARTSGTRPGAENPLLLSGLAFAGANQRAKAGPNEDEGILTAEEIAAMNLQGTEWAVLSACDTGLGEVKAGEGVFGLRRAFQVAGVRTVIMSLWSVEDEATRRWMRALYQARLNDRLDTAESVRTASLRVLKDRRARHLSTHPFYWAAFVAAGDWR